MSRKAVHNHLACLFRGEDVTVSSPHMGRVPQVPQCSGRDGSAGAGPAAPRGACLSGVARRSCVRACGMRDSRDGVLRGPPRGATVRPGCSAPSLRPAFTSAAGFVRVLLCYPHVGRGGSRPGAVRMSPLLQDTGVLGHELVAGVKGPPVRGSMASIHVLGLRGTFRFLKENYLEHVATA